MRRSTAGSETAELFDVELSGDQRLPITVGEPMSLGSVLVFLRHAEAEASAPSPPRQERVVAAPEMVKVMELATRIARGLVAVLLTGETGVGKEVIAHAIHESSPRAARPFVAIHCAALPEAFAERELFGHEVGAFTGATEAKPGLFESAEGGTVFLDEIAELSPSLQTKLLRIVEDKMLLRVGSTTPRPIDIRILSATNRNLEELVAAGQLRQDLYFRLNGITIHVPPLRVRTVEISELARVFAAQTAWAMGEKPPELAPEVIARLQARVWPGNVRELRNVIERAVVLATGGRVELAHLHLEDPPSAAMPIATPTLPGELAELEKQRIVEALARAGGNQTRAAELLGMPRRTLVTRLGEYGIGRKR